MSEYEEKPGPRDKDSPTSIQDMAIIRGDDQGSPQSRNAKGFVARMYSALGLTPEVISAQSTIAARLTMRTFDERLLEAERRADRILARLGIE